MNSLRGNNKIFLKNTNNEIKFQVVDWEAINEEKADESEDEKKKFKDNKEYIVRAYGVTEKGTSISLNIHNFPPHFYINVPDNWTKIHMTTFIKFIKSKLNDYYKDSILQYDFKSRKKFWGFTNNEPFKFVRLMFKNTYAMNKVVKILSDKVKIPGLHFKEKKYEQYESNIQPFIRFMHINDIKPAGWIMLESNDYTINNDNNSNCQINLDCDWKQVKHLESDDMAPLLIASFDIEADSSHGDFPLAKKNYKKLANDILEKYKKYINLIKKLKKECKHEQALKYQCLIDDRQKFILNCLKAAFFNKYADNDINVVYTKGEVKPKLDLLEVVAKKIDKIIDSAESYKLLGNNIIKKYEFDILDLPDLTWLSIDNYKGFQKLIEDAFADDESKKDCVTMCSLYTKNNDKPKKSTIISISKKTLLIYKKLIHQIFDLDKQLNGDFELLLDIFRNYGQFTNESFCDGFCREKMLNIKTLDSINKLIDLSVNRMLSIYDDKFPEINSSRDTKINRMIDCLKVLPELEGDKVIQIGTTIQKFGEKDCFMKHMITLKGCTNIDGCIVESYNNESDVLLAWTRFIQKLDPDIITGYNIFGFDFAYMYHRAEELGCEEEFSQLGRVKDKVNVLNEKKLSSSALGDNTLRFIPTDGRVQMDLLKIIQRDHNLVSYKLDYVAETFINDDIVNVNGKSMEIKGSINLNDGNFITLNVDGSEFRKGQKFKIKKENTIIKLDENLESELSGKSIKWQLAKDDVKPQDIFRLQKGSDSDRQIVAVYCIQDCKLCLDIINKLDLLTNNIGMANVCSVPLSYIFLRGQGVKIFSLVSKQCRKENFLIPVVRHQSDEQSSYNQKFEYTPETNFASNEDGYEGAIVLKPNPGIYLKEPVAVLDYASLYPSSMISENLSHDTIILDDKYQGDTGAELLKSMGLDYVDITYDTFSWVDIKIKNKGKQKSGTKTCRFVQFENEEKGVIPRILQHLLKARKDTRKKIKTEKDEFKKSVLDGLQLAYKMTANSLYGQIGARTSPIYLKDIAASTTATGRRLLNLAKDKVQIHIPGTSIVYGDTDSIFVNFNPTDSDGNKLEGKEALEKSIELGLKFENEFRQYLKPPHNLEYEKTFWPFILLSKKRYVGNKYETDINKFKRTSMGIVLKRRDNADIVKYVYGGIIDIIMNTKLNNPIDKSIKFLNKSLNDLIEGKFGMEMLIITKSLRGYYKNPELIAHKVLADRMGERDPGNKPSSNDRIPYVYVNVKEKKGSKILQGDRIEHPDYIKEHNLKPDYNFYISNQIKNPVSQIYGLIVEEISNKSKKYFENKYKHYLKEFDEKKAQSKMTDYNVKEAGDIIFKDILRKAENKKNNVRDISTYFKIANK